MVLLGLIFDSSFGNVTRIWDCFHWKLVKTLTTTYRGEVSTIKNLLPKRFIALHESLSNDFSRVNVPQHGAESGLREGRIRMLSIGDNHPLHR